MKRFRVLALLAFGLIPVRTQAQTAPAEPPYSAGGLYERFRRVRARIAAPVAFLGHTAKVKDGKHVLVTGVLQPEPFGMGKDFSGVEVTFPMPKKPHGYGPLAVEIDGKKVTQIDLPDLVELRHQFGQEAPFQFQPAVFSGQDFPDGAFVQPSQVEDALGEYTTQITFYDADYHVVTKAEKAGRYGAVITINSKNEGVFKRYVTLYRQHGTADWRNYQLSSQLQLPDEVGIDSSVLKERTADLNDLLTDDLKEGFTSNSDSAPLLAGLREMKPGEGIAKWNNSYQRDSLWWYGLKKKIGELKPLHYLADLPDGYAADKSKKWPLVLFLHGSGESGDDLSLLRKHGPPKLVAEGHKFPFILISPQAPLGTYIIGPQMMDLIDEVSAKYNVDPDRIYMTGLSMGGYTTWFTALQYPERFAAIAPMAAGADPSGADRLHNLPTWYFAGGKDVNLRPTEVQKAAEAMRAANPAFKFTFYPEASHSETWTQAYNDPAFYEWMLAQKRSH